MVPMRATILRRLPRPPALQRLRCRAAVAALLIACLALLAAPTRAQSLDKSQSGLRLSAGNRYYRRNDIHINDFFFLDMSGYGGGRG